MPASRDTVYQLARVLIQECGVTKARRIAERFATETTERKIGNSSYIQIIHALHAQMAKLHPGDNIETIYRSWPPK